MKPLPKQPRNIKDIIASRIEQRLNEKSAPSTGYVTLDRLIKGFIPSHLYCLSAETNAGKTALAANFTHRMLKQGARVLYLALEPEETILDYIASAEHNKRFEDLVEADYTLHQNLTIMTSKEIDSIDVLQSTLESIGHFDLIIIDHISYFIRSLENSTQQQSNAIKELARLASEKQSAIIMIAHLRKPQSGKEKNRSNFDISGSAAFYQDSDEVMLLYRERTDLTDINSQFSNIGKLLVTKSKSGMNGGIILYFSNDKAKILDEEDIRMEVYTKQELNYAN